jgi:hypothetical protein
MVEPVVVKPETDSKKASTKPGISPASIKAKALATEIKSQVRKVIIMPSLARKSSFAGFFKLARLADRKRTTATSPKLFRASIVSP